MHLYSNGNALDMESHTSESTELLDRENSPSLVDPIFNRTRPSTFSYPVLPTQAIPIENGVTHWWLFAINNIIIALILVGNLATIILIYRYKKLQSVTYSFVVSLACADLLMGLAYPVYNVLNYTLITEDKSTLHIPCALSLYFIVASAGVSNLQLMVVSVDRYIAVVHPLSYHMKMTKRRANISIIAIWTYIILASLSMLPVYGHDSKTYYNSSCSLLNLIPSWYFFGIILPHMLIPNIISKCLYWRIVRVAHNLESRTHNDRLGLGLHRAKKEYKAAKMMAILLAIFLLCWAPYTILHIVIYSIGTNSPTGLYTALEISKVFAVSNSCINPLIYTWKSSGFRRALRYCSRCKVPSVDAEFLADVDRNRSGRSSSSVSNGSAVSVRANVSRPIKY